MDKDSKDFDNSEDEIVYIAVKDDSDNDEENKMALISDVSKNDKWIVDNGFSHHMTGDKINFEHKELYDGFSMRFGNNEPYCKKGKGCILLTNEHRCDDFYCEGHISNECGIVE